MLPVTTNGIDDCCYRERTQNAVPDASQSSDMVIERHDCSFIGSAGSENTTCLPHEASWVCSIAAHEFLGE